MQEEKEIKINRTDDNPEKFPLFLKINYPKTNIDVSPLALNSMASELSNGTIRIIFAGESIFEQFEWIKFNAPGSYYREESMMLGNYDSVRGVPKNRSGKKIVSLDSYLGDFIKKYAIGYKVAFEMPTKWNPFEKKHEITEECTPLLSNAEGEVISYIADSKFGSLEIILPECENKHELIDILISEKLPAIYPEYFSESSDFNWLEAKEYKSLEEIELEEQKYFAKIEYDKKIKELDDNINMAKENNYYFKQLLTESGNELVLAVKKYFNWLGFQDVKTMDEEEETLREDIQIKDNDNLYIIEVKGIQGTSTDSECAQIAKHRRRRERENPDKNVIPIYIVNHQRYVKPEMRLNPPFSDDQIEYAINDERGLLTTWEMFKQYRLIENGIFSKDDTREMLRKFGVISLVPDNLRKVGIVKEYFKRHNAGIVDIENTNLKVGDCIYCMKHNDWKIGIIQSIQLDGKDVSEANNGEIGIVLDIEVSKGFVLYKKQQ